MSEEHRILIHGGTVIDGNNVPGVRADVLIEDDRIVRIGRVDSVIDAEKIDATGKIVAPGFIDPHNHANSEVKGGILKYPLADNLIRQGITTVMCNHCGGSTYPVGPFLESVDKVGAATNVAMLASYSRTRRLAMERTEISTPCPKVWEVMRDLLSEEMENGAYGVTTGPLGRTQEQVPTAELIEAARAVAPFGGVYDSHIRDEGETNQHVEAIEEVYTIAKESGAGGQVSHLKLWGYPNWGKTEPVIEIFDRAEAEGIKMAADQYPYIGGYRGFYSLLWDFQGPKQTDAAWKSGAEEEVRRQLDILGGPERLIISSHEQDDPLDGKTIGEAGKILGVAPEAVVTELYMRDPRPSLSAFFLAMQEEDVQVFMKSEHTMAGTDSHVRIPGSGASHPRNYGTYPRLLGKYVREEKIMPLEQMIFRMTARVADHLGIKDRGRLVPGAYADVVIFDPETVCDRSTWQNGYLYPEGIQWVLVNGGIEVANERFLEKGFGRALRRGE
ncbi:amidohydrolase family protein [Candidatus Poribacteria bacterium]